VHGVGKKLYLLMPESGSFAAVATLQRHEIFRMSEDYVPPGRFAIGVHHAASR
tara:strand:- start:1371 stop:1529 length:159 start_codon:yes stop_codon:yes gene_type:complete